MDYWKNGNSVDFPDGVSIFNSPKIIPWNVGFAEQLATSRNLKVNLASESAQAFNGSTNAEDIGVSGILPITHGGTGATTAAGARTNLGLGNLPNVNPGVSHMYFDTHNYALRINVGSSSVRNGGVSLLVQVANNNDFCILELYCWKSTNAAMTNVKAHVIYRSLKNSSLPHSVSYKASADGNNYLYVYSTSTSSLNTSFTVLGNSMRLAENNESIVCEQVARSEATTGTTAVSLTVGAVGFTHTNEINFPNVPENDSNVWFEYRNGDTDSQDASHPVEKFIFANRNALVDGVSIVAGRLRLHKGESIAGDSGNYAELILASDSSGVEGSGTDKNSPKIVLQGSYDPRFGVFTTNAHSGSSAKGVQLDAEANGNVGVYGYNGNGVYKWLCYIDSSGVASLGGASDTQVRLGNTLINPSSINADTVDGLHFVTGSLGSTPNTIYIL